MILCFCQRVAFISVTQLSTVLLCGSARKITPFLGAVCLAGTRLRHTRVWTVLSPLHPRVMIVHLCTSVWRGCPLKPFLDQT